MTKEEVLNLTYEKLMDDIRRAVKRGGTCVFITDIDYEINSSRLIADGFILKESFDKFEIKNGWWVSWFEVDVKK